MRSSCGSLGFAAPAVAAAIIACCASAALARDEPSEARLRAAERLLAAQGEVGFTPEVSALLAKLAVADLSRQQPNVRQICWDAVTIQLTAFLQTESEGARAKVAHNYASHLDEGDLNTLADFFGSELGKRYFSAEAASGGADFLKQGIIPGIVEFMKQESRDDLRVDERLAIMLDHVRGRLNEDDMIAITNFFSIGAGRRYLEQTAAIARDSGPSEAALRGLEQRIDTELRQNGACT